MRPGADQSLDEVGEDVRPKERGPSTHSVVLTGRLELVEHRGAELHPEGGWIEEKKRSKTPSLQHRQTMRRRRA